jgi:SAM-dependent methyltransferase
VSSSNYQKYQTRNPLVRRLIRRFLDHLCTRIVEIHPSTVIDLGCGEGVVAGEVRGVLPEVRYLGIDASGEAIRAARVSNPDLDFRQGDILDGHPEDAAAELALCLEVLEHLDDPSVALERIAAVTSDAAIVSVPWEPYFQLGSLLRGRYLKTWGNHPEHVQSFSPPSLRDLVARHFPCVDIDTCFPWLIAVARKRSAADRPPASG